jgi:hypothetical protein
MVPGPTLEKPSSTSETETSLTDDVPLTAGHARRVPLLRPSPAPRAADGTVESVFALWDRLRSASWSLHVVLILFVLLWLLGPPELRSAIPIWIPFLIALGLEVLFFVEAQRGGGSRRRPDRGPSASDRDRYGYAAETDELLLVRRGDEEVWIPYSGQTPEEIDELIADAEAEPPEPTPSVPVRPWHQPIRRFLVGVGLIGALAVVVWLVERNRGWDGLDAEARAAATERFSAEASRVAGHAVTIRCDESGEIVGVVQHTDGVAEVGGDLAYLTPQRCYDLYRLAFDGDVSFSQTARAVAVLAHEAWHLNGVRDEGTTECYALQSGVELGQRLGLDDDTARQMMRQQLVENAGRGAASEYVVGPECRDGGELDLDPDDSEFP